MEEIRFRAEFDDSEVIRGMNNVIGAVQRGEDAFQDLNSTADRAFDGVSANAQQAAASIQGATQRIGAFGATLDQATGRIKLTGQASQNLAFQLQDVFVQLASGQGIFRTLIQQGPQITSIFGGIGNTFKFLGQQALLAAKRVLTLRNGFRLLVGSVAALIALPLIAFFSKSGRAANLFEQAIQGVTSAFSVLVDRAADFGKVLFDAFSGRASLSQVFDALKASVTGLGAEMTEAAERAGELTRQLQRVQELQRGFELLAIEQAKQAEILRLRSEDENRTTTERIALLRRAQAIETEIRNDQIGLLEQQIFLSRQRNDSEEDIFKLIKERNELQAENEISRIQNEQEINALLDDQKSRYAELINTISEAQATLAGPAAIAQRNFELARQEIEKLRQEAQALGKDLDFSANEILIEERLKRELDAARGVLEELPTLLETAVTSSSEKIGETIAVGVGKGVEKGSTEISDEVRYLIERDLFNAFENAAELFAIQTDAQIAQQERIISAIEERTATLEDELRQQLRLQEQGYANDVDNLKAKLAEETEALKREEEKRIALEKKAAKQRLAIDSALQASQITLAVAKLLSSAGSLGPFGIIAAATAGVAFIFSTIARAKALSTQFEPPGFYEGTPFVDGARIPNKRKDNIPALLHPGERVLPAKLNAAIGGKAISNDELVRLYKVGVTYEKFGGIDLEALATLLRGSKEAADNAERDLKYLAMKNAYKEAALMSADKMIDYWQTRPVEWMEGDGTKVIERKVGNSIERRRVK